MARYFTEQDVYKIAENLGVDGASRAKVANAVEQYRKDTVGDRPNLNGRIYENGPFSVLTEEVTSLCASGGSPLLQWMPTRSMAARKHKVSHLNFIAPGGFTGAETYPEWLAGIEIGECGYGPAGADWNGFEYEMDSGSFSFTTKPMKLYEDGGINYYEEQPLISVRSAPGQPPGSMVIQNDADWALALTLMNMESHMSYVADFGDSANSVMEWDGLDMINRPGYAQARIVGSGHAQWADPVWVNAAGVSSLGQILQTIRLIVRTIRKRARQRNWQIALGDMVLYMDGAMWDNLLEAQAAGAMFNFTNVYGFDGRVDLDTFERRIEATRAAQAINVDGVLIPVLVNDNLGAGVDMTVDDGEGGEITVPAVIGDIHLLTRRAGGMTFWFQEYLDWNMLDYPAAAWSEDRFTMQGGIVRAGYVSEASKCYYYFMEMVGRMVCTMLPMQARIANVVVPLLGQMEMEQAAFYARNYYAFGGNGTRGGEGTDLLVASP